MEDRIDSFYNKTLGKDSALFIGTLWLGMIAKHMNEVRITSDEARQFLKAEFSFCQKWLDKLQSLYDNVEFKTDIPFSGKGKLILFEDLVLDENLQKYVLKEFELTKKELYLRWFDKIQKMIDLIGKMGEPNNENERVILSRRRELVKELGKCQRTFYMEIEKKHLIMPPEKEDFKDMVKDDWIDRKKSKDLYSEYLDENKQINKFEEVVNSDDS